ncbi:WD40/YVTN/BNR-like repeat-containing protein [Mucilaginibacter myungsuensis]|uniref:Photosynthesis system II assembly factor Ycf48/Hcf136-like domain-containing protein n=1 Tax=Mucilaginibacter myungsuensis TaxID=649104 RepID=A0A929L3L6_9SPHI|nr:YCF48-related protein [Mucilaginibacter myungsuensis]MBE9662611.1 hypothetical protein [Mucilaginibacter myungsuensis]MDN3598031.1 YCF48-related protein [Mucilaginibacter myungsuensis]
MKNKLLLFALLILATFSACRKNTGGEINVDYWPKIRHLTMDSLKTLTTNIPKADYYDLTFTDSLTGYAVTTGAIIKTINGGLSWTSIPSPANVPLKRVQFTDSQTGYIAGGIGNAGILLKTTNAGQTWTVINFGTTEPLTGMYFISNTTGFIIGDNLFSKTTDGGQTWTSVKEAGANGFHDIRFKNAQTGIATAAKGMYFKTTNGGNTWLKVQTTTTNNLGNVYFTPERTLINKSADTLINVDANMAITKIDPAIFKLHFVNDNDAVGIGNKFGTGFWPNGMVFVTNRSSWTTYQMKGFEPSQVFNFTSIAAMNDYKIMIIGTGLNDTKVMTINR